jgi:hypothetical protein
MRSEVETYDQYLTGHVFGYIVENGEGEQLDSCWGYFGEAHCVEEGRAVAACLAEACAIGERTELAEALEASRPDMYRTALPDG